MWPGVTLGLIATAVIAGAALLHEGKYAVVDRFLYETDEPASTRSLFRAWATYTGISMSLVLAAASMSIFIAPRAVGCPLV